MMLAHIPIETVFGIFFLPTILLCVCGTTAVVFFMNRRQDFDQETSEKPHVPRKLSPLGKNSQAIAQAKMITIALRSTTGDQDETT